MQFVTRSSCLSQVEIEGYGSRRDMVDVPNNPVDPNMGNHQVPFTGAHQGPHSLLILISQRQFMANMTLMLTKRLDRVMYITGCFVQGLSTLIAAISASSWRKDTEGWRRDSRLG